MVLQSGASSPRVCIHKEAIAIIKILLLKIGYDS